MCIIVNNCPISISLLLTYKRYVKTNFFYSDIKSKNPGDPYNPPVIVHPTPEPPPVPPLSFGCKCGALDEESLGGVTHGKTFGRGRKSHWKITFVSDFEQILCLNNY